MEDKVQKYIILVSKFNNIISLPPYLTIAL